MTDFKIYNIENAPEASKPLLEGSIKAFGMIPNLHGVYAESPEALEAYQTLTRLFFQCSLSTTEKHLVWLAINVYHGCHYCVPAHSFLAKRDNVDDELVEKLRNDEPLGDDKLQALKDFTIKVLETRGNVSESDVDTFLSYGYTKRNIMDVLLAVTHKVMSNYTNHITKTEVDVPFAQFAWEGKPQHA